MAERHGCVLFRKYEVKIDAHDENEEDQVRDALAGLPIIADACVLLQMMGKRPYPYGILYVRDLIMEVNPNFPSDSFDVPTVAHILMNPVTSVDEYRIFKSTIPYGNPRAVYRVTDGYRSVKFECSPKHGGYYEVEFSNKITRYWPMDVTVTLYSDMDDVDSHVCELNGDDCNCEPHEVVGESLMIEDWSDHFVEDVSKFVEEVLGL